MNNTVRMFLLLVGKDWRFIRSRILIAWTIHGAVWLLLLVHTFYGLANVPSALLFSPLPIMVAYWTIYDAQMRLFGLDPATSATAFWRTRPISPFMLVGSKLALWFGAMILVPFFIRALFYRLAPESWGAIDWILFSWSSIVTHTAVFGILLLPFLFVEPNKDKNPRNKWPLAMLSMGSMLGFMFVMYILIWDPLMNLRDLVPTREEYGIRLTVGELQKLAIIVAFLVCAFGFYALRQWRVLAVAATGAVGFWILTEAFWRVDVASRFFQEEEREGLQVDSAVDETDGLPIAIGWERAEGKEGFLGLFRDSLSIHGKYVEMATGPYFVIPQKVAVESGSRNGVPIKPARGRVVSPFSHSDWARFLAAGREEGEVERDRTVPLYEAAIGFFETFPGHAALSGTVSFAIAKPRRLGRHPIEPGASLELGQKRWRVESANVGQNEIEFKISTGALHLSVRGDDLDDAWNPSRYGIILRHRDKPEFGVMGRRSFMDTERIGGFFTSSGSLRFRRHDELDGEHWPTPEGLREWLTGAVVEIYDSEIVGWKEAEFTFDSIPVGR